MQYVPSNSTYASIRSLEYFRGPRRGSTLQTCIQAREEEKQSGGERCHPVLGPLWLPWVASLEDEPFQGGTERGDGRRGKLLIATMVGSRLHVALPPVHIPSSPSRCHCKTSYSPTSSNR